ncbi:hypothetical protein RB195_009974 [Necator americanus]|uniref:Uncharacterized protein n=1 Tax=Necator americanus TaxID=51031 RepID=A0ABR1CVR5_NECAM
MTEIPVTLRNPLLLSEMHLNAQKQNQFLSIIIWLACNSVETVWYSRIVAKKKFTITFKQKINMKGTFQ